MSWTKANRDINPATAIVIYAWNQHDKRRRAPTPALQAKGKPRNVALTAAMRKLLKILNVLVKSN